MNTRNARSRSPAEEITPLHAHALGNLKFIRSSMEAAGSLAVPGIAGSVMGLVGLVAALLVAIPELQSYWLGIWLIAAVLAFSVGAALLVRQARITRFALYRGPVRKFVLCLGPGLLCGVVLTAMLWQHALVQLLPSVWLLIYGAALLAASTTTTALVGLLGCVFMLFGIAAALLPFSWQNVVLGAGFGGLHLVFGVLIARQSHGD